MKHFKRGHNFWDTLYNRGLGYTVITSVKPYIIKQYTIQSLINTHQSDYKYASKREQLSQGTIERSIIINAFHAVGMSRDDKLQISQMSKFWNLVTLFGIAPRNAFI